MADLLELAERRKVELQEQVDTLQRQIVELDQFIATGRSLAAEPAAAPATGHAADRHGRNGATRLTVQAGSAAGRAARLILDKGPLALADLVRAIAGGDLSSQDREKARNNINSALWRRKDLFERGEDKRFHLRTQEVGFVD